jgi:hypothetical protein
VIPDASEVNEHSLYPTDAEVPPLPSDFVESFEDEAVDDGAP